MLDGANGGFLIDTQIADKPWVVDRIADVSGDGVNDIITGSLYTNNHVYFIDTYTSEIMFDENYGQPVDAIKSILDITGDGSMEMVVGGRNGTIICYSGGLDAPVGVEENPHLSGPQKTPNQVRKHQHLPRWQLQYPS